jgi:hypothetical protein
VNLRHYIVQIAKREPAPVGVAATFLVVCLGCIALAVWLIRDAVSDSSHVLPSWVIIGMGGVAALCLAGVCFAWSGLPIRFAQKYVERSERIPPRKSDFDWSLHRNNFN